MATLSIPSTSTGNRGICPVPFFQEDLFPSTGGFLPGRFCMPIDIGNITCCLPCPATDWTYRDGFNQRTQIANWVNVAAFVVTAFLLLSFIILPVKWTHRHYLNICLTIGVMFMELAFIVPLASKPDQCYNAITPNNLHSDATCAVSGAFLLFGGWAAIIWVFIRALSLHLQICWEVIPGNKFFVSALFFGWSIPSAGLAIALGLTGVSYRFGNVCHINHNDGLQDFWGPMLAFAAIALVLQFITLGYCIQVFVKSLIDESNTTDTSSNLPSHTGSLRTVTAKATFRRVRRVLELQWKGAMVVLVIIAEVVFFSIVFVSMDNSAQISPALIEKATPWLLCLWHQGGDKTQCLSLVHGFVKPEGIVLTVLVVLGLSGFWCLIFLGRWSMVLGWIDLLKTRLMPRHEFVSADARRLSSNDPRTYELLSASSRATPHLNIKSPDRVVMSPGSIRNTPFSPNQESKTDYFAATQTYVSPVSSFSSPRPPSAQHQAQEWDSRHTFAQGNTMPGTAIRKDYGA